MDDKPAPAHSETEASPAPSLSVAALILGIAALLAFAGPRPQLDNTAQNWLPKRHPGFTAYQSMLTRFGSDEVVTLLVRAQSVPNCLQDIRSLTDFLQKHEAVEQVLSLASLHPEALEVLLDDSLGGFSEANQRRILWQLRGPLSTKLRLFDPDVKQACLFVLLKPGQATVRETLLRDLAPILKQMQAAGSECLMAGHPLVNLELDKAARAVEQKAMPMLVLLSALVLLLSTRSPRLTALIFIPVGLSVFVSDGLLGWFGADSNLIVAIAKPLIFVLTMATGFHLLVAYQLALGQGLEPGPAALKARQSKTLPSVLALMTTAFGFGSLMVSDITPIFRFAWITALSLMLSLPLLLGALPALMARFTTRAEARDPARALTAWPLMKWAQSRPYALLFGSLLLLTAALLCFQRLPVQVHAIKYLSKDNQLRQHHQDLEQNQYPLASLEWIVESERPWHTQRQALGAIAQALQELERDPDVLSHLGLTLVLKEGSFQGSKSTDLPAENLLKEAIEDIANEAPGLIDRDSRSLRISILTNTVGPEETARILKALETACVSKELKGFGLKWHVTGLYPLLIETQQSLLSTLIKSLSSTALLMELTIILFLGSWRLGLIAFLPNILPVAVNIIVMTFLGLPLDVGTAMTAAIAMGIAVDDTLHLLTHWRQHGLERAAHETGRALILSSLVIATGFSSLLLSDFGPTRAFGILCASAMAWALLADLTLLPALLTFMSESATSAVDTEMDDS